MKIRIIWKGSGWYSYRDKSGRWEKTRLDRIVDLRLDDVPVKFLETPPEGWEVITPEDVPLIPGKDFKPDDEVMIIYAGEQKRGEIVKPGKSPGTWIVTTTHKSGRPHEETIHELFLHKIGNPEKIDHDN